MTRRFWGIILLAFALTAGLGLALAASRPVVRPVRRTAAEQAWRSRPVRRAREDCRRPTPPTRPSWSCAPGVPRPSATTRGPNPSFSRWPRRRPAVMPRSSSACSRPIKGSAPKPARRFSTCCSPPRTPTPRGTFLRAGRAARALGRFEDANGFFREAVALAPDDVEINTAWGELFLEKYNHADAVRSFEPALKARRRLRPGPPRDGARARGRQPAAGASPSRSAP